MNRLSSSSVNLRGSRCGYRRERARGCCRSSSESRSSPPRQPACPSLAASSPPPPIPARVVSSRLDVSPSLLAASTPATRLTRSSPSTHPLRSQPLSTASCSVRRIVRILLFANSDVDSGQMLTIARGRFVGAEKTFGRFWKTVSVKETADGAFLVSSSLLSAQDVHSH
jgi:hypothetical protein